MVRTRFAHGPRQHTARDATPLPALQQGGHGGEGDRRRFEARQQLARVGAPVQLAGVVVVTGVDEALAVAQGLLGEALLVELSLRSASCWYGLGSSILASEPYVAEADSGNSVQEVVPVVVVTAHTAPRAAKAASRRSRSISSSGSGHGWWQEGSLFSSASFHRGWARGTRQDREELGGRVVVDEKAAVAGATT